MTRLLIIGGSDAGISVGLRARACDPGCDVTVVVADRFPNYSICGLPFYLSGEVPDWHALAHRKAEDIAREGIHLLLDSECYTSSSIMLCKVVKGEMFVETRSTQLLKGTLDMCLLATLAQRPCYGYELVQQLAQQGLDLVSEGSIYPLLSRLQQHGYIEGYLVASRDGPQRKYYRLLPAGAKQLEHWQAEWERFAQAVERILKGARSDAQS